MPRAKKRVNWRHEFPVVPALTEDLKLRILGELNAALKKLPGAPRLTRRGQREVIEDLNYLRQRYYFLVSRKKWPTPKQIASSLRALSKSCATMQQAVTELDDATLSILASVLPEGFLEPTDNISTLSLDPLNALISILGQAATDVSEHINGKKRLDRDMLRMSSVFWVDPLQKQPDALRAFLSDAASIFFMATSIKPTCYYDRSSELYVGSYVRFAVACAESIGRSGSGLSVPKAASDALRKWDSSNLVGPALVTPKKRGSGQ